MAAAVPFAIKGGMALASYIGSRKAAKKSTEQQAAMAGTQQAGQQLIGAGQPLLQQGAGLTKQGAGYAGSAGDYYQRILSNRGAARESLAPEMTTALDFYRGASNKTARTMRGGARDTALAELDRQKVGQMAGMLPAARRSAAEGLGGLAGQYFGAGGQATGSGAGLLGQGAGAMNALYNQASQQKEQERKAGAGFGNMLYDLAGSFGSKTPSVANTAINWERNLPNYAGPPTFFGT